MFFGMTNSPATFQTMMNNIFQNLTVEDIVVIYLVLSQSLDNLGITQDECLGRTQWSSLLDLITYLYYFTSSWASITT